MYQCVVSTKCFCLSGKSKVQDSVYMRACVLSGFSWVQLFVSPWTTACQAPLSLDSPGTNTGVGCHALLQGTFPTQGSNPQLLHW